MTTVITGDTGVSAIQDGAVAQADLAANVVGNGPAFSAYLTGTQTLSAGAFTNIIPNIEEFDTANAFSDGIFTAPVAGYYLLTMVAGPLASTSTALRIHKRTLIGSVDTYHRVSQSDISAAPLISVLSGSALIYLAVGDLITFQARFGISSSVLTGRELNVVAGVLVRAA